MAFALAMSLGATSTDSLAEIDAKGFFQPGQFRDSFNSIAKTNRVESQQKTTSLHMAQWLNWLNICFNGMWRRC
jgi:hypothetical protein